MPRLIALSLVAACSGSAPHTPAETSPREDLVAQWNRHFEAKETGPAMCAAGGLDKTCTSDGDCMLVEEIFGECRTTAEIAVNAKGKAAFDAAGHTDPCAHKRCPSCVVRWTFTEDCATSGTPVVSCVAGKCLTHAPPADAN